MNDKFYAQLVHDIEAGLVYAVVASPPCGTYSAARFLAMNSSDLGPIPLRDIDNPDGFPLSLLPVEYHRELLAAQLLVRRLADLLLLADSHGVHWVIENPAPRHDKDYLDGRLFYEPTAKHGSLWTTTPIDELARTTSSRLRHGPLHAEVHVPTVFERAPPHAVIAGGIAVRPPVGNAYKGHR